MLCLFSFLVVFSGLCVCFLSSFSLLSVFPSVPSVFILFLYSSIHLPVFPVSITFHIFSFLSFVFSIFSPISYYFLLLSVFHSVLRFLPVLVFFLFPFLARFFSLCFYVFSPFLSLSLLCSSHFQPCCLSDISASSRTLFFICLSVPEQCRVTHITAGQCVV